MPACFLSADEAAHITALAVREKHQTANCSPIAASLRRAAQERRASSRFRLVNIRAKGRRSRPVALCAPATAAVHERRHFTDRRSAGWISRPSNCRSRRKRNELLEDRFAVSPCIRTAPQFPHLNSTVGLSTCSAGGAVGVPSASGAGTTLRSFFEGWACCVPQSGPNMSSTSSILFQPVRMRLLLKLVHRSDVSHG